MALALVAELYLSVVIWAIRDPPVYIIPHQWATKLAGNLFSVTAAIDKSLKYKFPLLSHLPFSELCGTSLWFLCVSVLI